MEAIEELSAVGGHEELSPFRAGQAVFDPDNPGRVVWTEPPDVWFDVVSKIQTLVEDTTPAHQYLNPHDPGGIQVVLCYREY